ncbi:unnamed protein product [Nippostrongylus brasiliensis]|uniref:Uncharacterized protein n=1 Tax=Nippostrongylus brasiliensis TaxID=27835 RepID=A0A0N4XIZ6_NIPBR|nr:hypothetical protein Q1695_007067 [Nippostrongylus brasiliensis]VDL66088.1 unnamed protein product [Nippostrongylus brasiliensis]
MSIVQKLAIFAVLVGVATAALTCYSGQDTPSQTKQCAEDTLFCKKGAHGSGEGGSATIAYDCDDTGNCQNNGCFSGPGGYTTCCCNSNKCNSSTKLSTLTGLVSVFLTKLCVL